MLGEDLRQDLERQWCLRGRLDDDRVPHSQRRRHFEHQEEQRVVPGDQTADHPVRGAEHQGELSWIVGWGDPTPEGPGELGVLVEEIARHVDVQVITGEGAAGLDGQRLCQAISLRLDGVADRMEVPAPLRLGAVSPDRVCPGRGADGLDEL